MKFGVVIFPGSNCDHDMLHVLGNVMQQEVVALWHKDSQLPDDLDCVVLPGGFSYGDYLRCGAIAARSPIAQAVIAHAGRGGHVLGVCNGFQVLVETGLLPGVLMRNAGLKFICKPVALSVDSTDSAFTSGYARGQQITIPIAHHDGNFQADPETLARIEGEGQVAFRYVQNPNGSLNAIAGVMSANRRVLGMMPHPERAISASHGGTEGATLFAGLMRAMALT